MERRRFLQGTASGSLAFIAGCGSNVNQTGSAELEWEYEWEGFIGTGYQPAIIVTGEAENVGSAYADEFDLDCQLLAKDGSVIDSREQTLRHIEQTEEQLFYWKFRPDEEEAKQVESVEIEGNFPDQ